MGIKTKTKTITVLISFLLLSVSILFLVKTLRPENDQAEGEENVKGDNTVICTNIEEKVNEIFSNLSLPRKWYVKSSYANETEVSLTIPITEENLKIRYILDQKESYGIKDINGWNIKIPVSDIEVGEKNLTILADICDKQISKEISFTVSEPIYVTWTIDWEGIDVKDEYLNQMSTVSKKYSIPMTHFFNPNIYVYISNERANFLTNWVKERNSKYNESIGLHLHMYDKLVTASGVIPNDTIAWGSYLGNGHDTPNSTYGYDDYKKIIIWSISQFNKNGINTPRMFRAGGWYIDEENIQVLNSLDFNIESSGRTYYKHGENNLEGHWNLKNTTQPYQLNRDDQNILNTPNMNIWEFPNNGGDSWAYNSKQLISNFQANYNGGTANSLKIVTFLSHPHWFDKEGPKIQAVFEEIKKYNYISDSGPVIYLPLDKVYEDIVKL